MSSRAATYTPESVRPTYAEIDLDALKANAMRISELAQAPLIAVVKANAYGHGVLACAQALSATGVVQFLGVSLIEEGIELRDAGILDDILVMGPAMAGGEALFFEHNLTPLISSSRDLTAFGELAQRRNQPLSVHLKVDSGMGRLGFAPDEFVAVLDRIPLGLKVSALATHFANADVDELNDPDSQTAAQMRIFAGLYQRARQRFPTIVAHMANSAGALRFPMSRCDMIRPGLALYGGGSGEEIGMRQVMRLRTQVAAVRHLSAGRRVSYGGIWQAERDSTIAVLPLGYADGIPRAASNRGTVLIAGQRFPIVGAVCMDMTMVDVTDLVGVSPSASAGLVGQEAVLLGSQRSENIRISQFASSGNLIDYEVTCGISKRVPRRYHSSS